MHQPSVCVMSTLLLHQVQNQDSPVYPGLRGQAADAINAATKRRRACNLVMSYVCFHMLPALPQGAEQSKNAFLSIDTEAALDMCRLSTEAIARKGQAMISLFVHLPDCTACSLNIPFVNKKIIQNRSTSIKIIEKYQTIFQQSTKTDQESIKHQLKSDLGPKRPQDPTKSHPRPPKTTPNTSKDLSL